jgi:hypothetical protein
VKSAGISAPRIQDLVAGLSPAEPAYAGAPYPGGRDAMGGRGALIESLAAAQRYHGVDMLDHHRAFLDAGPAGGAGPQRVGVGAGR